MRSGLLCASGFIFTALSASAATRVLEAFEGDGFGSWKVEGKGFGLAPIAGSLDGVNGDFTGYSGDSLVCSGHGGDAGTGSLTSPAFKVTESHIAFLVAGGKIPGATAVQLLVDGKVDREATGEGSLKCKPVVWDVSALKGKTVSIRIIDTISEQGKWGIIAADHFILTDSDKPVFPPATRNGQAGGELVASDIPGLTIPPGTKAKILADYKTLSVTSPTALAFGENGNIFISETHRFRHGVPDNRDHLYWYLDDISSRTTADRRKMYEKWQNKEAKTSLKFLTEEEDLVRELSDPDESGVFRKQSVFAGKFNDLLDGPAAGVFAYEGTVFLACIPKIHALRDGGKGEATSRDVIQDGFGVRVSFSGHDLNGFVLGPDGRIYGTLGDRGMNIVTREGKHYEMPDEGCVFRFDPDGTNFEVVHSGLRNPKEIAFDEFGNAISVDNNCDQGDKARVVYIVEGADSGWNMGHQGLLVHHKQMGMEERPPARWMAEKEWELQNPDQPAYIIPPSGHITSGPSGLTYHPGTGFLESEAGRFLVCDYKGGAGLSGIWSFKVEPSGAGMKMTGASKLNWGAAVTDVEYSWDGKLAVTDFIGGWASHDGGRVYSVEAEKPWRAEEAAETAKLVKEGFEQRQPNELAKLLLHPDMRVRLRAEFALTRKADGLAILAKAATQKQNRLARLHGVWGMGIIARRGSAVLPGAPTTANPPAALRENARKGLVALLSDPDIEVRAQAIRALGESGLSPEGIPFDSLVADASPRVQLFAAIAAGKLGATSAIPAILKMLAPSEDPYIRHGGSYALSLLQKPAELAALKANASPRVRMAAVVALRRLAAPELAVYLADTDPAVADEAIRSINDQNVAAVRPKVAELLDSPSPAKHTTMIWRRLLHSAFRAGDEANARRVLKTALDPQVPDDTRKEAFRLLAEWSKPSPVDQSTGRMSPLPARDGEIIRKVLGAGTTELLQTDGKFLEPALSLIEKNNLDLSAVPDKVIESFVLNDKLPGDARAEALELYAARKPAGLADMLAKLSTGKDDDLAIAALRRLVKDSPDAALAGLQKATADGSARRKQEAWILAAGLSAPGATDLFVNGLAALTKSGGVSPAALELLDAAAKRQEPGVKSALDSYKAAITAASATDPLAPYLSTLEGGNAEKGGQLFESHPAGQCMRCHAGGHGGGDAGPNLSGVALRGDRKYFLESLVNPGAKVAMGYGLAAVTLKGGKTVSGVLIADTPDHMDFDSSGKILRVSRADIETTTPPVSSMPPMGMMLKPDETRDIIAWLATQKSPSRDNKKRPAPELVKP